MNKNSKSTSGRDDAHDERDLDKGQMPAHLREAMERKKKSKGDDEDDMDKAEYPSSGDEEKKEAMDKGDVSREELDKSLGFLEGLLEKSAVSRRDSLMEAVQNGTATQAQREELAKSVLGESDEGVHAELSKSLDADTDTLRKSDGAHVDATDFLHELRDDIVKGFSVVAEGIDRTASDGEDVQIALVKSVRDIGRAVMAQGHIMKALSEQLDTWGRAPARGPRSQAAPIDPSLTKSYADRGGFDADLTKSQVQRGLRTMMQAAIDNENRDEADRIIKAATIHEQTNNLDEALLRRVRALYAAS